MRIIKKHALRLVLAGSLALITLVVISIRSIGFDRTTSDYIQEGMPLSAVERIIGVSSGDYSVVRYTNAFSSGKQLFGGPGTGLSTRELVWKNDAGCILVTLDTEDIVIGHHYFDANGYYDIDEIVIRLFRRILRLK